jgi:hypothetical protein
MIVAKLILLFAAGCGNAAFIFFLKSFTYIGSTFRSSCACLGSQDWTHGYVEQERCIMHFCGEGVDRIKMRMQKGTSRLSHGISLFCESIYQKPGAIAKV